MTDKAVFEGWCIIEQMGHKRMAGFVSEQVIGGHSFIRVDVPGADPTTFAATQFITGQTIYAITPCTEELARRLAETCQPKPVTEYDLPRRLSLTSRSGDDDDDDDASV